MMVCRIIVRTAALVDTDPAPQQHGLMQLCGNPPGIIDLSNECWERDPRFLSNSIRNGGHGQLLQVENPPGASCTGEYLPLACSGNNTPFPVSLQLVKGN